MAASAPLSRPDRSARRPGGWPDPQQVRRRLADASTQLVALRCELDDLQADLAWLQVTAAGGPDLEEPA